LRFLQALAAEREKFPSTSPEAQQTDALVADILDKAMKRGG
jgi:hypothetical protein